MSHASETELVELYYGEAAGAVPAHLEACRECREQYAELCGCLDAVRPAAAPARPAHYGEQVWAALRPRLVRYRSRRERLRGRAAALALGLGVAALVAAAFLGGRYWERRTGSGAVARSERTGALPGAPPAAFAEHLDRSERLLVALEHAGLPGAADRLELQEEARELEASNRLYQALAQRAGDPLMAGTLERLEGVLAEVANDPRLTAGDLDRVRQGMDTRGILFEVRVLRSRRPARGRSPHRGAGALAG